MRPNSVVAILSPDLSIILGHILRTAANHCQAVCPNIIDDSAELVYVAGMAKRKLTNADGYDSVMTALREMGHKSPQSALAKMLGFAGRQSVNNWTRPRGIPAAHAYRVSLLTGVPMSVILPDVVEAVEKQLKEFANEKTAPAQSR